MLQMKHLVAALLVSSIILGAVIVHAIMAKTLKWFFAGLAILICGFVCVFIFLVADSGTARVTTIKQSLSPDGQFSAEVDQLITPMHGGPDTIQVRLKRVKRGPEVIIYERTYGCSNDYRGYDVRWMTVKDLTVVYGACDSGRWHSPDENNVHTKIARAQGVDITFEDSGHTAH